MTLSAAGREQAAVLTEQFASTRLAAIYTSPLRRAADTADLIARPHLLQPVVMDAFTEVDYGDWTGAAVADLEDDADWRDYNTLRGMTRIPGGELILETQARAVAGLLEVQRRHEERTILVVSHADVIRAILGHLLGIPMDHLLRLEIAPASVSTIELAGAWPRVLCMGSALC